MGMDLFFFFTGVQFIFLPSLFPFWILLNPKCWCLDKAQGSTWFPSPGNLLSVIGVLQGAKGIKACA